ncbi:MAG TPA: DUF4097 family beta strand repeat-containing protein [Gemmatimonadaceae bacterium]|nr:DUF4097 family beta strand repeat-containing protein [Gemmatimonadaceae bacterium]
MTSRSSLRRASHGLGCAVTLTLLWSAGAAAQQRVELRRALVTGGTVRVFLPLGSVRVLVGEDTVVSVSAPQAAAGKLVMAGDARVLKVGINREPGGSTPTVDLEVRVPRSAHLGVRTDSADIDIANVEGGVEVFTAGGRVRVAASPRELRVESLDGNIEIESAASVTAKSASGWIVVRGTSPDVELSSVSGRVALGGDAFARGRVETISGEVRFVGSFATGGSLDIATQSGAVTLRLPANVSADFDITSAHGAIQNGLSNTRATPQASGTGSVLRFTQGDGGAAVTIHTFKGPVTLIRQ